MGIGGDAVVRNCALRGLVMMLDGFRDGGIRAAIWTVALVVCGLSPLQASAALVLSPDGITVYDTVNNISWLADANLPATNRFGLPVCTASGTEACIHASGSMSYQSAGLVVPGEFQFNLVVLASLGNGDQPITATYGGATTQPGALITIHN